MEDPYIEQIYNSVNYGQFRIINFSHRKGKCRWYIIEFLDEYDVEGFVGKYRTVSLITNIKTGKVRNPYKPTIANIACVGEPIRHQYYIKEYTLWVSIIERCYNPNSVNYHKYGAKGISVCKRWLCFSNFQKDLPYINGYNNWIFNTNRFHLDKDKLQYNIPHNYRYYGLDTCQFIPSIENSIFNSNIIPIVVMSPYHNFYKNYDNKAECERNIGIDHKTFNKYINTGNCYNNFYFYTNLKTVYRKVCI